MSVLARSSLILKKIPFCSPIHELHDKERERGERDTPSLQDHLLVAGSAGAGDLICSELQQRVFVLWFVKVCACVRADVRARIGVTASKLNIDQSSHPLLVIISFLSCLNRETRESLATHPFHSFLSPPFDSHDLPFVMGDTSLTRESFCLSRGEQRFALAFVPAFRCPSSRINQPPQHTEILSVSLRRSFFSPDCNDDDADDGCEHTHPVTNRRRESGSRRLKHTLSLTFKQKGSDNWIMILSLCLLFRIKK